MLVEEYESSFRYLNEALKVDIHSATAYRLKGFNYKYAGDTVNAVSSFQTAIEQDPNDYDSVPTTWLTVFNSIEACCD